MLISQLDFEKLRKNSLSNSDDEISNFFKQGASENGTFMTIFNEVIKASGLPLNYYIKESDLSMIIATIQSLIKLDRTELFKVLVLDKAQEMKSGQNELIDNESNKEPPLKRFLNFLDSDPNFSYNSSRNMNLVKIFITVSNVGLYRFKDQKMDQQIIQDMIEIIENEMLANLKASSAIKRRISYLFLGVFSWDTDLILQGLKTKEIEDEVNLLTKLFESFSYSQASFKSVLPVFGEILFKQIGKRSLSQEQLKALEASEVFIQENSSLSLLEAASKTLKNDKSVMIIKTAETESFFRGICDGSIFSMLINTYIKDEKMRELIRNILQIVIDSNNTFFYEKDKAKNQNQNLLADFTPLLKSLEDYLPKESLLIMSKVIEIYTMLQAQTLPDTNTLKNFTLRLFKDLLMTIDATDKRSLLSNLVEITLGIDLNDLKIHDAEDFTIEDRKRLFVRETLPKLLSMMNKGSIDPKLLQEILAQVQEISKSLKQALEDPKQITSTIGDLTACLKEKGFVPEKLIKPIIALTKGDLQGVRELATNVLPKEIAVNINEVISYIEKALTLRNEYVQKFSIPYKQRNLVEGRKEITQES